MLHSITSGFAVDEEVNDMSYGARRKGSFCFERSF